MSEMDQLTKELMSDPHVFADAFNLLLYDGNPMIRPEKLTLNHGIYDLESSENKSGQVSDSGEDAGNCDAILGASSEAKVRQEHVFEDSSEVLLLPDDPVLRLVEENLETQHQIHLERLRDILKRCVWMSDDAHHYLIMGIENQTEVHYLMPLRTMLYDALTYARQMSDLRAKLRKEQAPLKHMIQGAPKNTKVRGVITLVCYFGKKSWDAPTHLHEIVDVDDEHLLRYIPNYFINLLDPHCIPIEKIDKLQSELGAIYACYHAEKAQTIAQFIESDQRFDNISNVACRIINHLFTFEIAPVSHESEETMNLNKYIQERYQQEYDKGYKAAQDKEAEHTLRLIKTHEESLRAVIADNTQKLDDAKREADDAKREADDAKRKADDAKRSQLEAIKRLKQRGMTCADIADIMGLSAAEIEKLVCPCFS